MISLLTVLFILSCVIFFLYYFWVCLLVLFYVKPHDEDGDFSDISEFCYFLLIPCLNEEKVIYKTVNTLMSINIPNLTIIAIDDGSADMTLDILNSVKHASFLVLRRDLPNARKGKGSVLNAGYNIVKRIADEKGLDHSKVIIGVLDADTHFKPHLLNKVAAIMRHNPKVGMVQSRVRISAINGLLQYMQDIEFFTLINTMQNLRAYIGTVAAAGNGQFNRLSAIETLGDEPWSSCLLEDFDFSLRLLLNGWKTGLIQDEYVCQQGVPRYGRFIKQRARWAQGGIQCISYLNDIRKSSCIKALGKIEIYSFLMLPWFTLLASLTILLLWTFIICSYFLRSCYMWLLFSPYSTGELWALLIIILFMTFLPGIVFSVLYRREAKISLYKSILMGLFVPIYNILQIPAVLIAFGRQALGIRSWSKTDREVE